ncbi:MAG: LytTR family DNA-binding domain-containing protein [Undibacterium sp.]|nr:LytTR family DNA-binding domain-containing protein [Undibacterium sp.]
MDSLIRALIVDDEELGRKNLFLALSDYANWQVVAQASSVATARSVMATLGVDVIFLDIQMPRETGLALARELASGEKMPLVIFVTAYNEHAVEAFELHALDYLLKPLDDKRLARALERAEAMLALRQQANYAIALRAYVQDEGRLTTNQHREYWQQVSVRAIGRIETILLSEVFWIEAQGNYMQLHLGQRQILYRAPMNQLEKKLDPQIFLRIHRSTIVRIDQIQSLCAVKTGGYDLQLRCGDRLNVSEKYYAKVKEVINSR